MPVTRSALSIVAIIPVGALDGAKSRLGAVLDAEERLELTIGLARRTIGAAVAARRIDEVLVITPDDAVRALALKLGARPILQRDSGLNHGVIAARDEAIAAGAGAILILPIDLPDVTPDAIDAVAAQLEATDPPLVAIVPDRHGRGTNSPPQFGRTRFICLATADIKTSILSCRYRLRPVRQVVGRILHAPLSISNAIFSPFD